MLAKRWRVMSGMASTIFNYFFRWVGIFGRKGPWILGMVGFLEKLIETYE
jgi:hypothetical protein